MQTRDVAATEVLRALLLNLAQSRARILLLNLEDLWLETCPQNTPGTTTQRVNWRRKAGHTLEEMKRLRGVTETLAAVDEERMRRSG